MPTNQSEEDFFKQRGFGQKLGFGERPAMIVIDMVKAFTDPKRPLGADLDRQIEATKPLLDVAHERNFPVLFSTVRYDDVELRDAGIWALKMKGSVTLGIPTAGRLTRASTSAVPTACCSRNTPPVSSAPTWCRG